MFFRVRLMKSELEKEVEKLFAMSEEIHEVYSTEKIRGLPQPVQRYFDYSLREHQKCVSYARLKHGGQFRPAKKWVPIKGQEYFTLQPPGFVWFGKAGFMSGKDSYYDGTGNLKIKLLSILKVVDAKGIEANQGELIRWLAETPLFPTALLPSKRLRWEPVDGSSSKAILTDRDLVVEGTFYFDGQGQITWFKAKRPRDRNLENWTIIYRDYKEASGMQIPFDIEAIWNLEPGDFSYARFKIDQIEHDVPSRFK